MKKEKWILENFVMLGYDNLNILVMNLCCVRLCMWRIFSYVMLFVLGVFVLLSESFFILRGFVMYGYVFLFLNLFGSCINLIEVLKKYNEWGKRDNCYCKNGKKKKKIW